MTRGASQEEREQIAAEARAELEALPVEPICVRIATAVKLTGIGRSTIYELIASGQIETVKIGRSTFIPYRCLKRLFDGEKVAVPDGGEGLAWEDGPNGR